MEVTRKPLPRRWLVVGAERDASYDRLSQELGREAEREERRTVLSRESRAELLGSAYDPEDYYQG